MEIKDSDLRASLAALASESAGQPWVPQNADGVLVWTAHLQVIDARAPEPAKTAYLKVRMDLSCACN